MVLEQDSKVLRENSVLEAEKSPLQKNRPDLSGNIVVAVFGFIRCRLYFLAIWFTTRDLTWLYGMVF